MRLKYLDKLGERQAKKRGKNENKEERERRKTDR